MSRFLYHYSTKPYRYLLTSDFQNKLNQDPFLIKFRPEYNKDELIKLLNVKSNDSRSISFFIDGIDYVNLPNYYSNKHFFYKNNVVCYEHKVNIDKVFVNGCVYLLAEPESKTRILLDDNTKEEELTDKILSSYVEEKLYGVDKANFIRLFESNRSTKKLMKYYAGLDYSKFKHPQIKEMRNTLCQRYAGFIPHFIIYPYNSLIPVSEINKFTFGKLGCEEIKITSAFENW